MKHCMVAITECTIGGPEDSQKITAWVIKARAKDQLQAYIERLEADGLAMVIEDTAVDGSGEQWREG